MDSEEYQNLLKKSIEFSNLNNFIENLNNKENTRIGENGAMISGGQSQRIGIARAIYQDKDILIFDEATSALDSETESSVMESILSLDKDLTIIIVAHRLSTLKNCTNIIELSDGKILRQGVYNEII